MVFPMNARSFWTSGAWLIPPAGIVLSVVLYVIAAGYYPGGSGVDPSHQGFDWLHNYWCDLIARNGRNGAPNAARPVAMIAMIVLFSSLSFFWFLLPVFFRESRLSRVLIGYAGLASMFMLVFIYTKYHDEVILTGGAFCSIPVIGTLRELRHNRWRILFLLGLLALALILLNAYMYLSGWRIVFLPLVQKITLAAFLAWILLISGKCMLFLRNAPAVADLSATEKRQLPA